MSQWWRTIKRSSFSSVEWGPSRVFPECSPLSNLSSNTLLHAVRVNQPMGLFCVSCPKNWSACTQFKYIHAMKKHIHILKVLFFFPCWACCVTGSRAAVLSIARPLVGSRHDPQSKSIRIVVESKNLQQINCLTNWTLQSQNLNTI